MMMVSSFSSIVLGASVSDVTRYLPVSQSFRCNFVASIAFQAQFQKGRKLGRLVCYSMLRAMDGLDE